MLALEIGIAPSKTDAPHSLNMPDATVAKRSTPEFETIVHEFRYWCDVQPDKVLYRWLDEQGLQTVALTYLDVLQRANAVAQQLRTIGLNPGDRAACMYLPGLDFIATFWGCMFAGVVAVPVYPVDLRSAKVS